ncbi:MAG: hypothetical protein ABIL14_01335 [candidate division WOR-3 bacterium]
MAEIVLTYALASSVPAYNNGIAPYMNQELRLNLHHNIGRVFTDIPVYNVKVDALKVLRTFNPDISLDLSPFLQLTDMTPARAGAEAELRLGFDIFDIGFYHRSEHNLDRYGKPLSIDAIRLHWKLK